jgi:hypothetical protein
MLPAPRLESSRRAPPPDAPTELREKAVGATGRLNEGPLRSGTPEPGNSRHGREAERAKWDDSGLAALEYATATSRRSLLEIVDGGYTLPVVTGTESGHQHDFKQDFFNGIDPNRSFEQKQIVPNSCFLPSCEAIFAASLLNSGGDPVPPCYTSRTHAC